MCENECHLQLINPYTQKEQCKKTQYIYRNVEITYSLKYMYVSPKYMNHSHLE